ncbi:MAG: RnfH family protein [Burkholderiales bacterium]
MSDAHIQVTLVYAYAPRQVFELALELPAGACAQDALLVSGLYEQHPNLAQHLQVKACVLDIWGIRVQLDSPLKNRDRLAVCRPLQIDPKAARRERFKRQGIKRAGLFAAAKSGKSP